VRVAFASTPPSLVRGRWDAEKIKRYTLQLRELGREDLHDRPVGADQVLAR